jgi:hypothetical protein
MKVSGSPVAAPSLLAAATAALLTMTGSTMAQQCPLAAPLVVKDLQGGVVGQTGTIWTVAPDCSFTVARQIGAKIADAHKQGRLSAEQQQRLAALIGQANFAAFPDRLGGTPQPNGRQITVSYGRTVSVATLPPDAAPGASPATAGDQRVNQTIELARFLDDIIGG